MARTKQDIVRKTALVPKKLAEKLRRRSFTSGDSQSAIIVRALDRELERESAG
jgi:hypothetical protein